MMANESSTGQTGNRRDMIERAIAADDSCISAGNPSTGQTAQARQMAETLLAFPVNYPTREEDTVAALVEFAQDVAFKARCAEGERIAHRCFSELPLDPNVSDGNESADPADHIIPCVKAALTAASAAKDEQAKRDGAREALESLRREFESWRDVEVRARPDDPVVDVLRVAINAIAARISESR